LCWFSLRGEIAKYILFSNFFSCSLCSSLSFSLLRFLCKIKEAEILESLIPSVTSNLEHRHSYVRKNAVLTVFHIYEAHAELIPDAPELIETFLYNESNPAAKRNAFLMLFHCDLERAVNFLQSVLSTVGSLGESFQLVVLELIRKVCRSNPAAKGEYIRCIFTLLNCPSHSVAFEGANTLVALSSAPTAVRAAIAAYCQLLQHESDHNIKLIILAKLSSLRKRHLRILQDTLMDILRTLASPSIDIKRRTLELAMELLSSRNVDEVVQLLKKELIKTEQTAQNPGESNLAAAGGVASMIPGSGAGVRSVTDAYRKILMDSMHICAVKFPDVVPTVVHLLVNYLGDEHTAAAQDVAAFVREIVHEYPNLRDSILTKVLENFADIRAPEVYRTCVWILGEYATEPAILDASLAAIKSAVGHLPLLAKQPAAAAAEAAAAVATLGPNATPKSHLHDVNKARKGPVVLADGTYASSSAAGSVVAPDSSKSAVATSSSPAPAFPSNQSHLRTLLLGGDYLLGSVLANALAKLSLRYANVAGLGTPEANEEIARALLFAVSLLRMGQSPLAAKAIDPDNLQRVSVLVTLLLEPSANTLALLGAADGSVSNGAPVGSNGRLASAQVFETMLDDQRKKAPGAASLLKKSGKHKKGGVAAADAEAAKIEVVKQADELIVIRQLKGQQASTHTSFYSVHIRTCMPACPSISFFFASGCLIVDDEKIFCRADALCK
jgi:coatomer subunit beta